MKVIELTHPEFSEGTYMGSPSALFRLLLWDEPGTLDAQPFQQGFCVLVPPDRDFTLSSVGAKEAPLEIAFSPELLPASLSPERNAILVLDEPPSAFAAYMRAFAGLLSMGLDACSPASESGLASLLSWFSLFCSKGAGAASHSHSLADQAKEIIRTEYMSDLTLQSVAARLFVNPCYLSTVFHQSVGTTFRAYLRDVRLSETCRLLSETNSMITDIAMQTGFNSTAYLISSFRKAYGITPNAYRSRLSRQ